jgi:hypothetical protein
MSTEKTIEIVSRELGITVVGKDETEQKQILADKVNDLLLHDFEKLVSILYRIDVNESKLKSLLKQYPGTDAGSIIASLMIERQEEKRISRSQFKSKNENIDEDEKW